MDSKLKGIEGEGGWEGEERGRRGHMGGVKHLMRIYLYDSYFRIERLLSM